MRPCLTNISPQADLDIPLLQKIIDNSKRHYKDGVPLHRHRSARSVAFDSSSSCVFVTTAKEMRRMSAIDIQRIFRDRHILLLDVEPTQDWAFDLESLGRLAPCDLERQLQGEPPPSNPSASRLLIYAQWPT